MDRNNLHGYLLLQFILIKTVDVKFMKLKTLIILK